MKKVLAMILALCVLFTLAASSYGSDASQPHLELRLVDVRPAL